MLQFIDVLLQQLVFLVMFIQELNRQSFKKRLYNYNTSFRNKSKRNDTTLAKYVWDLKLKHNVTPTFKWHVLKSVAPYSNIAKKCRLYLQEEFEILSYTNPDELLNKRFELISKCCNVNKIFQLNIKRMIDIILFDTLSNQNYLTTMNRFIIITVC